MLAKVDVNMRKLFAVVIVVTALAVFAVAFTALRVKKGLGREAATNAEASSVTASARVAEKRAPVVVELFTSEGCSSCPPADALLARLDREQPVEGAEVIALSQHVDYWNNLGWADPFSSHAFSERQGVYAGAFGNDGVYTPQMVVDGRAEFPGGESGKAFDTIARAAREPKAEVNLSRATDQSNADAALRLSVRVERLPKLSGGDTADVLLAVTESNLSSDVARGENAGRKLAHIGVVRELTKIGDAGATTPSLAAEPTIALDKNWRRDNLRAVVFVQERASKRIVGASSLKLF
jgi:hypothetical protein